MLKKILYPLIVLFLLGNAYASNYQLIVEPEQGQLPLVNQINNAKENIQLSIYQFIDATGTIDNVIKSIALARKRGVAVTVLMNNFAASNYPADGIKIFNFENSWCRKNNIICIPTTTAFQFTHNKYLIIDNKQANIMTMNLSDEDFQSGSTRNFVVEDINPLDINFIEKLFTTDMQNAKDSTAKTPVIPNNFIVSPENSVNNIINAINASHHSLDIYEMYFNTASPHFIMQSIVNAAKRGVKVRIISNRCEGNTLYSIKQMITQSPNIEAVLLNELQDHFFIHAKVFLVDNKFAVIGSNNISNTSFYLNRELNIKVNSPKILTKIQHTFNQDWQRFQNKDLVNINTMNKFYCASDMPKTLFEKVFYFYFNNLFKSL